MDLRPRAPATALLPLLLVVGCVDAGGGGFAPLYDERIDDSGLADVDTVATGTRPRAADQAPGSEAPRRRRGARQSRAGYPGSPVEQAAAAVARNRHTVTAPLVPEPPAPPSRPQPLVPVPPTGPVPSCATEVAGPAPLDPDLARLLPRVPGAMWVGPDDPPPSLEQRLIEWNTSGDGKYLQLTLTPRGYMVLMAGRLGEPGPALRAPFPPGDYAAIAAAIAQSRFQEWDLAYLDVLPGPRLEHHALVTRGPGPPRGVTCRGARVCPPGFMELVERVRSAWGAPLDVFVGARSRLFDVLQARRIMLRGLLDGELVSLDLRSGGLIERVGEGSLVPERRVLRDGAFRAAVEALHRAQFATWTSSVRVEGGQGSGPPDRQTISVDGDHVVTCSLPYRERCDPRFEGLFRRLADAWRSATPGPLGWRASS